MSLARLMGLRWVCWGEMGGEGRSVREEEERDGGQNGEEVGS